MNLCLLSGDERLKYSNELYDYTYTPFVLVSLPRTLIQTGENWNHAEWMNLWMRKREKGKKSRHRWIKIIQRGHLDSPHFPECVGEGFSFMSGGVGAEPPGALTVRQSPCKRLLWRWTCMPMEACAQSVFRRWRGVAFHAVSATFCWRAVFLDVQWICNILDVAWYDLLSSNSICGVLMDVTNAFWVACWTCWKFWYQAQHAWSTVYYALCIVSLRNSGSICDICVLCCYSVAKGIPHVVLRDVIECVRYCSA